DAAALSRRVPHADCRHGPRFGRYARASRGKRLSSFPREALRSECAPAIDRIVRREELTPVALRDLEVGDEEIEVTRWLEESGRRRVSKEWLQKLTAPAAVPD